MGIPIVIGVTGHRDIIEADVPRLRGLVREQLKKLREEYPHSSFLMLNSLAAGADLLCAEEGLAQGFSLSCPLPLPIEAYEKDFSPADKLRLYAVLEKAQRVFISPPIEDAPPSPHRDFFYRQAGLYVARHSHLLFALWDGSAPKAAGCGTAEAVEAMLQGSYTKGAFRAGNDGAVLQIFTPRQRSPQEPPFSIRFIEKQAGSLKRILRRTDGFNKDAAAPEIKAGPLLLPEEYVEGGLLHRLRTLYEQADALSLRFQKKYLTSMKLFSLFGVLLVLLFLLYDEGEANVFLLLYGALLLTYLGAFLRVRRGGAHEKYLQYRTLSEALRTQFYLSAAGLFQNAGEQLTWTQKQDSTWVKEALSALLTLPPSDKAVPPRALRDYWIEGQLAYHREAQKRDKSKHRLSESTARVLLLCSVALFVLVLLLELCFAKLMTRPLLLPLPPVFLHHPEQEFTLRSLMKILLGAVSAGTLFLSGYYGKLSFERKALDHERMVLLYTAALESFERSDTDREALFLALAREEIIENGNWFSYCRENTPSFNV